MAAQAQHQSSEQGLHQTSFRSCKTNMMMMVVVVMLVVPLRSRSHGRQVTRPFTPEEPL